MVLNIANTTDTVALPEPAAADSDLARPVSARARCVLRSRPPVRLPQASSDGKKGNTGTAMKAGDGQEDSEQWCTLLGGMPQATTLS